MFMLFNGSTAVLAWDAGNPYSQCNGASGNLDPKQNSTCGGGFALMKAPSDAVGTAQLLAASRVSDCPAGYTNNGLTCGRNADTLSAGYGSVTANCPPSYTNNGPAGCGRGADTISSGMGSILASCPSGYTNMGLDCQKGLNPFDRTGNMVCPAGYFIGAAKRCYKTCPAGYTNTGETCFMGVSLLGPSAFTCPAGYFQGATKDRCHKTCPEGYTNTGETCFRGVSTLGASTMKCNADEIMTTDGARCGPGVPTNVKIRGNTHLFIVQQAVQMLRNASTSSPAAKLAYERMATPACAKEWIQGIYDGDEPALADNPSDLKNGVAGTHFYNPTNGMTYQLAGVDASTGGITGRPNLNARATAAKHIAAFQSASNTPQGCKQLGLALHYMTDMTQPMHTSSFSAANTPLALHPYYEAYVAQLHNTATANPWVIPTNRVSSDVMFDAAARKSYAKMPTLYAALTQKGKQCTMDGVDLGITYIGYCFIYDANVANLSKAVLAEAYDSTANYLFSVFSELK